MNILYYTTFEVSPTKGGTERITYSVAQSLTANHGHRCYSIFSVPSDKPCAKGPFVETRLIGYRSMKQEVSTYLREHDIDVIINQGDFHLTHIFYSAIQLSGRDCKQVFCHHFSAGSEEHFLQARALCQELCTRQKPLKALKTLAKLLLFPVLKLKNVRQLHRDYARTVQTADRVVLLSANFKKEFLDYAHMTESDNIEAIHNSLSFDTFFDMACYAEKKKQVLIVSRLSETPKKITIALEIWQLLQRDAALHDWQLVIVGTGPDEGMYKRFVSSHHLPNVRFEGRQLPEPYYRDASLFMLTSAWEGWGLTLTEAQQYACVPLAFNTYSSLTDIITDGENGYVIPAGDIEQYAERMKLLMTNVHLRQQMAANAVESAHRFEMSRIGEQWNELLHDITTNNSNTLCVNKIEITPPYQLAA